MRRATWPALAGLFLCAGLAFAQYGGYRTTSRGEVQERLELNKLRRRVKDLEGRLRRLERHVEIQGTSLVLKGQTIKVKARGSLRMESMMEIELASFGGLAARSSGTMAFRSGKAMTWKAAEAATLEAPGLIVNEGRRAVAAFQEMKEGEAAAAGPTPSEAIRLP